MNKKVFFKVFGIGTIVAAFLINVNYALDNYGIVKNNLTTQLHAQGSTSGGGSTSGDGSNSGNGSTSSQDDEAKRKKECLDSDGVWNHFSKFIDGGTSIVTVNVDRTLAIFEVFSWENKKAKKGMRWKVVWEKYSCTSDGNNSNCCKYQGYKIISETEL